MNSLHKIQLEILNRLQFEDGLGYMALKPDKKMENNQFQFHLDRLLGLGYVEKKDNLYALTKEGKQYAIHLNSEEVKITKQARLCVRVCPIRYVNGEKEYLIYTRLKHPFYGCQGFMSGKVEYGEKIVEAAKRELKEETNLDDDPKVAFITHIGTLDKENEQILEDRVMFVCIAENPQGELIPCRDGKYTWVSKKDLDEFVNKPVISKENFIQEIELVDSYDGKIELIEEWNDNSEKF